jgi:hypothetical protein
MKQTARVLTISFLLCLQSAVFAQSDTAYSFIVAGHAYGAHSGTNIGLHPPLLSSLDAGYDSKSAFIVLTGDIVNSSTTESWTQVASELDGYGLPYYYVMGNHGDNAIGWSVFEDKHGSTYYAFSSQSELYIVLNSTESGRSISSAQLTFLKDQLSAAGEDIKNVFIFFHEVLWNSDEKYINVRSNSRSRYSNIVDYSNYWEEVHPLLTAIPEKDFYLITGDVGGNSDAVAAFYDKWDNVTLISSGMGEVVDENYLLVRVISSNSIVFELVPLDNSLELDDLEYFSVPPAPEKIEGVDYILSWGALTFTIEDVFNADSYQWVKPEYSTGSSSSTSIVLEFDMDHFEEGELSVKASRDGFGSGSASSKTLRYRGMGTENEIKSSLVEIKDHYNSISIKVNLDESCALNLHLVDMMGRTIISESIAVAGHVEEFQIDKSNLKKGIHILSITSGSQHYTSKLMIN